MAASMAGFLSTAGVHLGNIITFPLSGVLCQYGFDGGWPSVFYVFGRCVRIGIMRMEFADLTYTKVTYLSVASVSIVYKSMAARFIVTTIIIVPQVC